MVHPAKTTPVSIASGPTERLDNRKRMVADKPSCRRIAEASIMPSPHHLTEEIHDRTRRPLRLPIARIDSPSTDGGLDEHVRSGWALRSLREGGRRCERWRSASAGQGAVGRRRKSGRHGACAYGAPRNIRHSGVQCFPARRVGAFEEKLRRGQPAPNVFASNVSHFARQWSARRQPKHWTLRCSMFRQPAITAFGNNSVAARPHLRFWALTFRTVSQRAATHWQEPWTLLCLCLRKLDRKC